MSSVFLVIIILLDASGDGFLKWFQDEHALQQVDDTRFEVISGQVNSIVTTLNQCESSNGCMAEEVRQQAIVDLQAICASILPPIQEGHFENAETALSKIYDIMYQLNELTF